MPSRTHIRRVAQARRAIRRRLDALGIEYGSAEHTELLKRQLGEITAYSRDARQTRNEDATYEGRMW